MANSTPRSDDTRKKHSYKIGTIVGAHTSQGIIAGDVYMVDGGEWIYVNWPHEAKDRPNRYLRSSQVFPLTKEEQEMFACLKKQ